MKPGRPKRVEKCGEFFGPLPKEESSNCSEEYFCASLFAPLLRNTSFLDLNNRVSSKSPFTQPHNLPEIDLCASVDASAPLRLRVARVEVCVAILYTRLDGCVVY
jgi:hypothetical protein